MKTCPKCGRTSPPALAQCPRCKTPFGAAVRQDSIQQSTSSSQPQSVRTKSLRAVIAISVVVVVALLALIAAFFLSDKIKMQSRMMIQKMQGKKWNYPPGDEAETAKRMSIQQLIEAWETIPGRSQTSLHATYAKALGLKGREAVSAVAVLSPYVLDKDLYLRQGAMAGLAGIGEEGLPYLVNALKYPDARRSDAATVRWDAAMALAKMGPRAKGAMQDLLASITDPNENPNVKGDAAVALAGIGSEAVAALNKARCYFYDQDGLSPSETGVLRTINIALSSLNASTEPCKGLAGRQSAGSSTEQPSSSTSMFLRADDLNRMQIPQLLEALRSHPYNTREIADELVRKGAKDQAAEVLTAMLKDSNRKSDLGI